MELWVGALNLGFLYALMTMGVFITYRIHDFPDITVDGSFAAGAAMAAFALHPTTVAQLLAIADAGKIMPPKSTWFEPKLRDGLLIHCF